MKLEFNYDKLVELSNLFEGPLYERLKRSILTIILGQKDELFQNSQDPDGNKWAPVSPKTKARKEAKAAKLSKAQTNTTFASHKILVDTGALQNSMTVEGATGSIQTTTGDQIIVGTNLPYAAALNYGYKTMPARRFMGFGDKDNEEIQEKIEAFVKKNGNV